MKLTPSIRRALRHLRQRPDAPISHRDRTGDIPPQVAAALERAGLATRFCHADGRDIILTGPNEERLRPTDPGRVTITDQGRSVANQPEPEVALYLASAGRPPHSDGDESSPAAHGLTADTDDIGAGGYIDPEDLNPQWSRDARGRHTDARDPRHRRRTALQRLRRIA